MREVQSRELVELAERFGEELDWGTRYIDLIATSIGAVFKAKGLDERVETMAMTRESVGMATTELKQYLAEHNRSANTIRTYVTSWRRIAGLAVDLYDAMDRNEEASFWAEINRYRDDRLQRRTNRGGSTSKLTTSNPTDDQDPIDNRKTINVETNSGTITLAFPEPLTAHDIAEILRAISAEVSD